MGKGRKAAVSQSRRAMVAFLAVAGGLCVGSIVSSSVAARHSSGAATADADWWRSPGSAAPPHGRRTFSDGQREDALGPARPVPGAANGRMRPALPARVKAPPLEPLVTMLQRWNPDDPDNVPEPFHETLQVFDFADPAERALALEYRNAELPFKVFNVPDLDAAAATWTDEYLTAKFSQGHHYKVEHSVDNHFMYWKPRNHKSMASLRGWTEPTKVVQKTFAQWLKAARDADADKLRHTDEHLYLMLGTSPLKTVNQRKAAEPVRKGSRGAAAAAAAAQSLRHRPVDADPNSWVMQDLGDMFSPTEPNFFVSNIKKNKGIQCRFGMRGVVAEAHYDGGRNMVAMVRGAKRYVLAPPSECEHLEIIKSREHPSFRHSSADWSDPKAQSPDSALADALAIDTVVHAGEILYIPSFWFHYIQSLGCSAQCNTRSGQPPPGFGDAAIARCLGEDFRRDAEAEASAGAGEQEGEEGP